MTTTAPIRAAVAELLDTLGATCRSQHRGSRRWLLPAGDGAFLRVAVHVRGTVTTAVDVDRWNAHPIRAAVTRPWMEHNVWPYVERWCQRTREPNPLPTGGIGAFTFALTSEVVDMLRLWLPQELAWQHDTATHGED